MNYQIMLLIVLSPIVFSVLGLLIGVKKKRKMIIVISTIIFFIFLIRAMFTFLAISIWN